MSHAPWSPPVNLNNQHVLLHFCDGAQNSGTVSLQNGQRTANTMKLDHTPEVSMMLTSACDLSEEWFVSKGGMGSHNNEMKARYKLTKLATWVPNHHRVTETERWGRGRYVRRWGKNTDGGRLDANMWNVYQVPECLRMFGWMSAPVVGDVAQPHRATLDLRMLTRTFHRLTLNPLKHIDVF